jgi:3-oxoacyl-[acyl-carrier protein] reductase
MGPDQPLAGRGQPLAGRVALVTGVSRRGGIGAAIARRLLADGASVLASGWAAHDAERSLADPVEIEALGEGPAGRPGALLYQAADLQDPAAADRLVAQAVERFGAIDIAVANHARSAEQALEQLTVEELDRSWAVNARASVLLVKALAERHDDRRPGGRAVLFTSGQHLGPMPSELPYAISKGAIHQMTASLADHLAGRGITVNCVNPGPVDTGWASGALHARIAGMFPAGRWGQPEDVARLVAWLVSDEAGWITGQVIDSEGGFRRR